MKTRTSITHPLRIDTLHIDGVPGLIGLTMCPGKSGPSSLGDYAWSRNLQADAKVIADWGADLWICLMEPEEMKTHGAGALPAAAGRVAGYMNLPISDLCAPAERFESAVSGMALDGRGGQRQQRRVGAAGGHGVERAHAGAREWPAGAPAAVAPASGSMR
jgi:hypothetical protein